jgi:hypothetical protein
MIFGFRAGPSRGASNGSSRDVSFALSSARRISAAVGSSSTCALFSSSNSSVFRSRFSQNSSSSSSGGVSVAVLRLGTGGLAGAAVIGVLGFASESREGTAVHSGRGVDAFEAILDTADGLADSHTRAEGVAVGCQLGLGLSSRSTTYRLWDW